MKPAFFFFLNRKWMVVKNTMIVKSDDNDLIDAQAPEVLPTITFVSSVKIRQSENVTLAKYNINSFDLCTSQKDFMDPSRYPLILF